jgi:hypothetical protein
LLWAAVKLHVFHGQEVDGEKHLSPSDERNFNKIIEKVVVKIYVLLHA